MSDPDAQYGPQFPVPDDVCGKWNIYQGGTGWSTNYHILHRVTGRIERHFTSLSKARHFALEHPDGR